MLYEILKIIHIISASILFGVGVCTAFYMLAANIGQDIEVIALATKRVVIADAWFTGISGFLQPVTGFLLLYLQQYPFTAAWTLTVTACYAIAGACWFIVVYLQIKCRDLAFVALNTQTPLTRQYRVYFWSWVVLGIPAFTALIIVFYLMTNNPLMPYTSDPGLLH
ncbi:MAG: Integral rane protein [Gammaproteobacteria bacterium]|jgi:uncharacterized membrane protein|nr:Integral rane protein [Gammaproteobacteria bacterium]